MTSSLSALVSRDRLLEHLRALEGERHPFDSPERLARAQRYVGDQLRQAGLDVHLDDVSYLGQSFVNVLARPVAVEETQPRLIVGAHLDTVPGTPGADDNTSGLAVMLETARVIMAHRPPAPANSRRAGPQAPVEFAAFTLEEVGMLGSGHYAARLKRQGVSLLGMVSLEMVGFTESEGRQQYPPLLKRFFPPVGNFIGLAANPRSKPLLQAVASAMRAIPGLPVETIVLPMNGWVVPESRLSDHSPFWDAGYQALLITDTAFLRNPHYHQPTDTIETLDLEFLERVCQGLVAAVDAVTAASTS